jgi:hypothetical protein
MIQEKSTFHIAVLSKIIYVPFDPFLGWPLFLAWAQRKSWMSPFLGAGAATNQKGVQGQV